MRPYLDQSPCATVLAARVVRDTPSYGSARSVGAAARRARHQAVDDRYCWQCGVTHSLVADPNMGSVHYCSECLDRYTRPPQTFEDINSGQ